MAEIKGRARGGIARAAALSEKRRKEIAQKASAARWGTPYATHSGTIHIGNLEIDCAVLEDGRRVLSQRGVNRALGRTHGGAEFRNRAASETGGELPIFLASKGLSSHISNELAAVVERPIIYRTERGAIAHGMEASLLPQICDVWIAADDAGDLRPHQRKVVRHARILLRGLADLGIIGLVDEATGYQEVRDRHALQAILDKYLRRELAAWAKRFPDEFYRQIFRLRGWEWKGMKVNRPQVVANYTNDFVWLRLAPGILEELQSRMPKDQKGRNKGRYPQLLTEDIGDPALAQHLHAVVALMKAAKNWDDFKRMLNAALPKKGANLELEFVEEQ